MKTLRIITWVVMIAATVSMQAQVVTQLAKENTKVPQGLRPDAKPDHYTPVEINMDTTSTYYIMLDSAQTMIDQQRWADAETYFTRAIASDPTHPANSMLLSNLATLQRYQGHLDKAIKNYSMALDMTPNSVTLLLNRAAAYIESGDTQSAIADYERVSQLDPTDVESRYSLGMLAVETHDYKRAEDLFSQITRINPHSGLASEGLGMMHKSLGHYTKAIQLLSEVIKAKPNARLLANRADCYLTQKQLNQAEEDIRAALSMTPDDPYLYVLRAKLAKLRFSHADMEQDIQLAVEKGLERKLVDALLN